MRKRHTMLATFGLTAMLALSPITAMAAETTAEDSQELLLAAEEESGSAYYVEVEKGPQQSDEECSLRLTFKHGNVAIEGAEITLTYVMGINLDLGRYYPVGELAEKYGEEVNFEDVPAVGLQSIATEIAGSNAKPSKKADMKTDKNGQVTFKDLEIGMYLVEQTGKSGVAADYNAFGPFLITIPAIADDGSYIYQIDCLPKTQTSIIPTTTPDTPSETPPTPIAGLEFSSLTGLPYMLAGGALAVLAVGGLAGGAVVVNKKRRD